MCIPKFINFISNSIYTYVWVIIIYWTIDMHAEAFVEKWIIESEMNFLYTVISKILLVESRWRIYGCSLQNCFNYFILENFSNKMLTVKSEYINSFYYIDVSFPIILFFTYFLIQKLYRLYSIYSYYKILAGLPVLNNISL